uniref:Sugar phosphate transporter domain-containing protein n=1 Tax=Eutreptiella gymnastica TaxID=73025 RepID=A0A7S4C8K5_9EUGL
MVPLPVMVTDWVLRSQRFSYGIQASVLTIVLGALVTGSGDLDLNIAGYGFAILSCGLQALYLVYAAKAHDVGYLSHGIMYYTSLMSIPILVILALGFEYQGLLAFPHWNQAGFLFCLVSAFGVGSLLNYALFLCCTLNSALTTVIVGQLKGMLSTILGFFLFGKVNITTVGVLGIALNSAGGVAYAWTKHMEKLAQSE